jgi:hypothetical protein
MHKGQDVGQGQDFTPLIYSFGVHAFHASYYLGARLPLNTNSHEGGSPNRTKSEFSNHFYAFQGKALPTQPPTHRHVPMSCNIRCVPASYTGALATLIWSD